MSEADRNYDLIVCGGGPGGIMAAIAAGRLGLKTLLIERHGFLGGMNTAALVGPIMSFHAGKLQIVRGIPGEIFDELKRRGGTPGHLVDPIWANTSMTPIDTEIYKPLLFEKVTEAGVELLLHSTVVQGKRSVGQVQEITVSNKKGLTPYRSRFYIDATGDGDLAAALGCEFTVGRREDQLTQPMTLMFKMAGVDIPQIKEAIRNHPQNFYLGFPVEEFLAFPGLAVSGFFSEVLQGKIDGKFPFDRDRVLFFGGVRPDEVSVNTLRIARVNGTNPADLTRAEATLRQQIPAMTDFLVRSIPGFKNAYVSETAAQVGVRETRHILGDYILTANDVLEQRAFEDVVAHASYPIDIHSPDGSGMKIVDPRKNKPESFYGIPYRCLIPRGIENLLITGRCISAEHEASASTRISATCMALGQAAGTAIYQAVSGQATSTRDISIAKLQDQLLEQGAFLVKN